jgi:MFS family permease
MPLFAHDLGAGSAGTAYGVLLFANGVGGVIGGILLEVTGRIKPTVKAAAVSTAIYGVTTLFFALTSSYLLALALLLIGGIANLASMSIGQTIVQLLAPPADRGRIIGLYGVSANGLRAGSGFTVGILGAAVGIHWSLGLSSVALCLGTLAAGIYALRDRPAAAAEAEAQAPTSATPAPPVRPSLDRTGTGVSLRQDAVDSGFHGVPAGPTHTSTPVRGRTGRPAGAQFRGVTVSASSTARTIRTPADGEQQPRADESQPPVSTREVGAVTAHVTERNQR